jgi:YidC/Oxa1 family membrane protein insertase
MVILIGYNYLFPQPQVTKTAKTIISKQAPAIVKPITIAEALTSTSEDRIQLDSDSFTATIFNATDGIVIDDLQLKQYNNTLGSDDGVRLFTPLATKSPSYFKVVWAYKDQADAGRFKVIEDYASLQSTQNIKQLADKTTYSHNITINGNRLETIITVVENAFIINHAITTCVEDNCIDGEYMPIYVLSSPIKESENMVVFSGVAGILAETLEQIDASDLDDGDIVFNLQKSWLGLSQGYWLQALLSPDADYAINTKITKDNKNYKLTYYHPTISKTGQTPPLYLFAGAKKLAILDSYQEQLDLPLLEKAIDFGWFYILTKPFLMAISFIYEHIGNFGVSIILFTVLVRLILFPLSYHSYKSLHGMKTLQPKIKEVKDKYGDNPTQLNQKIMELYKKEKINPLSGCLPILIQIPIFFALYKVFLIDVDMRHAPFFGWITDLSVPDPTSIFNLFGLLPYDVPPLLTIGIWPILVGLSMYFTQRMQPTPQDPTQAMIMRLFPPVFTLISANFPAGLCVYWTFSNLLSLVQQLIIRKKHGS